MDSRMTGMAEQFMSNWQSGVFRKRCTAQIDSIRSQIDPSPDSDDSMERFFAQNNSVELEEFVYQKSKSKDDYVSLIAEMMMMLRKQGGKKNANTSASSASEQPDVTNGAEEDSAK